MDLFKQHNISFSKALLSVVLVSVTYSSTAIELVGPKKKRQPVEVVEQAQSLYGPIKNSDTLWRIALNARQDPNLSVDQVMIAIFLANPQAFTDNNINLLKNGSLLKIPTSAEVRGITDSQAKQKIALDSEKLPQAKKNIASAESKPQPADIPTQTAEVDEQPTVQTSQLPTSQTFEQVPQASAPEPQEEEQPLAEAVLSQNEEPIAQPVNNVQLETAMADMALLIEENNALREQLKGVTDTLEEMQTQEAIDLQVHKELATLKAEIAQIELDKANEHSSILNNGWFIGSMTSIPMVLGLGGLFYFLVRRMKPIAPVVEEKKVVAAPQEPDLSLEDDVLDEELLDDELLISDDDDELASLDDLDDELLAPEDDQLEQSFSDDELLVPDDELDPVQLDVEESNGIVNEDDIDALLKEAESENDDIVSADDIDALLAEADAQEPAKSDEIVSADDIDALLAGAEADVSDEMEAVEPDDIDALLAESANEPASEALSADDIDALLDGDVAPEDDIDALLAENEPASEALSADDIDALLDGDVAPEDDIDALLAENEPASEALSADDIDALLDGDVAPEDDIDALLAENDPASEALSADDIDALLDGSDTGADDDIDALLAENEPASEALSADDIDALLDGDVAPEDDIDALLAENEPVSEELSSDDIDALLDGSDTGAEDDIDALLAEHEPASEELSSDDIDALLDGSDTGADDDIDALLAEHEPVSEELSSDDIDALLDGSDTGAEDDIDALLAENEPVSEELSSDDIDALLDGSDTGADDDIDALLAENEPASEELSSDDIDALLEETDEDALLQATLEGESDVAISADDIDAMLEDTDTEAPKDALDELNIDDVEALLEDTDIAIEEDVDEATTVIDSTDLDSLLEETELASDEDMATEAVDTNELDALLAETAIDDLPGSSAGEPLEESFKGLGDTATTVESAVDSENEALAAPFDDAELEALLAGDELAQGSEEVNANEDTLANDSPSIEQQMAEREAMYNADVVDKPYLITQEHDSLGVNASEEAQHLVDALDGMITPQPDGNTVHDPQLDELDDILAEQITDEVSDLEASEVELNSQLDKFEKENSFIDIDKLLNESAVSDENVEPYQDVDLDIGLSEFPEVLPTGDPIDVDDDPNNSSKKLDLARAYLEIEDEDSAVEILEFVLENGDESQLKEANRLMSKIKG